MCNAMRSDGWLQEIILHALYENGADVECLDNYIRDDVERLGTKLNSIHERMKSHLADLLVHIPFLYSSSLFLELIFILRSALLLPIAVAMMPTSWTAVNSLLGATSRRTSVMISSGLKSSVSTRNFRCQAYLCHYTCFKGECTMPTNQQMRRTSPSYLTVYPTSLTEEPIGPMSPPPKAISHHRHSNRLRVSLLSAKLALYKTSSWPNCMRIMMNH